MKTCLLVECGMGFVPKNRQQLYCVPAHASKAAKMRYQATRSRTVVCARDGCVRTFTTVDGRRKYCGHSCSAIVSNIGRTPDRFCLSCGSPFRAKPGAQRYCSRGCYNRHRSVVYIRDWLAGTETGSDRNGAIKNIVRVHLLKEADYRCQSPTCAVPGGWSVPNPITGKPILTVDHIDGNWKNNCRENLIVLCYSCHTLTPTFGALNKGNVSGTRSHPESRKR